MFDLTVPVTPRATALRVFGTMGAMVVALVIAAAAVRPEMLMAAARAVMGAMG